jgi:aldose 1-epimerase
LEDAKTITLTNTNNLTAVVSTFGATITRLLIPDRNNNPVNVVVGLADIDDYRSRHYQIQDLYLGSIIGRFAGRISDGYVEIEGTPYPIYNKGGIHLHGGHIGFDKKDWKIESVSRTAVTFYYLSSHLEEGYPGNLKIKLSYTLTDTDQLVLRYEAKTDKTTCINLTNHSYFNLSGSGTIMDHKLKIESDYVLEIDAFKIPTGSFLPVKNSKYDYSKRTKIRKPDFSGLDDTFVVDKSALKATLISEHTDIQMRVFSNQPGMVVYTPDSLPNLNYYNSVIYSEFPAICFETQHFPNSPHIGHFPSTLLKPEDTYVQETIFDFSKN